MDMRYKKRIISLTISFCLFPVQLSEEIIVEFCVLLTVHLITISVNNQLDAQFFFLIFVYSISLHVSSNHVLIIRRVNCINTTSGIRHSENN